MAPGRLGPLEGSLSSASSKLVEGVSDAAAEHLQHVLASHAEHANLGYCCGWIDVEAALPVCLCSCAHRLECGAVVKPDGAISAAHHHVTIVTAAPADCDACELGAPGVDHTTLIVPEAQRATLLQTQQAADSD